MDTMPAGFPPVPDANLLYYYGDTASATAKKSKVTGTKQKIMLAAGDINLSSAECINSVTLTSSGSIKVIVSIDAGLSWKSWNGSGWIDIEATTEDVLAKGMTQGSLGAITKAQWLLIGEKPLTMRFGYSLVPSSAAEVCQADRININVDMLGSWERQAVGTAYKELVGGRSGETISVSLLSNGDYKINY